MTDEATLSVMIPVEIDDDVLTSTTVSENDYSAYNAGTTYAIGDRCISTTTHRIYESAANSNTGHDPTDITNRTGNTVWWIDVSATNAWKMFDTESSTRTVKATSLTIVVEPGFVSAVYAGGLIADSATITVKDAPGGTTVLSETIQLENSYPPDYYEYFFSPFVQQPDLVVTDIPPYLNCEITFTLTIASGNVECGMFQCGDLRELGQTKFDARSIPKTYSYIGIDDYGNNEIKRRKSASDMSLTALIDLEMADTVVYLMRQIIDVPSLVIATTQTTHASLRVFGLVKPEMQYDEEDHCFLKLDVIGLI